LLLGSSRSLVGVLTEPQRESSEKGKNGKPAFILLNSGLIHRIGPNRLYVRIARNLAEKGHTVLRFDHSGIGDSLTRTDNVPYAERYRLEAREVMDWVAEHKGVDRFCLLGLCSGAMTSFDVASLDSRVIGVALINPRGLGGNTELMGSMENRWRMKEMANKFFTVKGLWRGLTGDAPYARVARVARDRLKGALKKEDLPNAFSEVAVNMKKLTSQKVNLLWISSDEDASREYFKLITAGQYKSLRTDEHVNYVLICRSNHTLDKLEAQDQALAAIDNWTSRNWPANWSAAGDS